MQDSLKIIGIGVFSIFVIILLGLVILFNVGLPVFDPGITETNITFMSIERKSTLNYPSEPYVNVSESKMNQCIILKTACQELIDNDQGSNVVELNSSEFNYIASFLETLSPDGVYGIWIYYQGFFFYIGFSVG